MEARLGLDSARDLACLIKGWGIGLGFQQIGIASLDLPVERARLEHWLDQGYQGEMAYMARHGQKRARPAELVQGTRSVISARMDYGLEPSSVTQQRLGDPSLGYISRYALGRDYHKLLRQRLNQLARQISAQVGPFGYRAFVDSAPVMEKPLAQRAGLGWIGKHTNLINRSAGSWFFLGELYTDLPLPPDPPALDHCGRCRACLDICPTGAIVAPYQLDASRCISYLTIELKGPIPQALRPLIGNRIFGCDDCQLVCPWNRFARPTEEPDFKPRHGLDQATLRGLFAWSEEVFLHHTEGSAIRRVGYPGWLRNLAVALGNAPPDPTVIETLLRHRAHPSELVREHVAWALGRQQQPGPGAAAVISRSPPEPRSHRSPGTGGS